MNAVNFRRKCYETSKNGNVNATKPVKKLKPKPKITLITHLIRRIPRRLSHTSKAIIKTEIIKRANMENTCFPLTTDELNNNQITSASAMETTTFKKPEDNSVKAVQSQDSVAYVGATHPQEPTSAPSFGSFVDLTKSDSDIIVQERKRLKAYQKSAKTKRQRGANNELATTSSVVTIQPVNNLATTSSENFGLIRPQNNFVVNTSIYNHFSNPEATNVFLHKTGPTDSSIQLKRTYPFTSVANQEDNKQTDLLGPSDCAGHSQDNEFLDVDKIFKKITTDIVSMELTEEERAVYDMDIDSVIELYKVDSTDNFDTLDV